MVVKCRANVYVWSRQSATVSGILDVCGIFKRSLDVKEGSRVSLS